MASDGSHADIRLKLLSGLGTGLWELRRSGTCCDVTVVASDVAFLCHKAVLCAVSPYFTAMFTHDMKESRDSMVTLHEVKADLFELLLESIYTGADIVNEQNVEDVMEIASLMQIGIILERCESHFNNKLSVDNFIDTWYTAKKYSCQRLEHIVWEFMLEHFTALSSNDDLSLLPFETLVALLRDDNLHANSEDVVCDVALKWLAADKDNRKRHAEDLLASLRIPLCSPEYIMGVLSHNEIFRGIRGSEEAIQEAYLYRMCPAKKHTFSSTQMTHRATGVPEDVMIIMGGADTSDYTGSGMRCYSFLRRQWFTLPSLPDNIGPHYASCAHGDDIYVSGGQYHREAFYKFQASTCSWFALSKMPSSRYQHAMVSLSDSVYTLGGEGLGSKNIDKYNVNTICWETCCELLDQTPHAVALVSGQSIIIFGGSGNETEYVQKFDPTSNQITRIESLKLPGIGSRVVTCGSINYVIATDGHVRVTSDKKASAVGQITSFNEQKFGICQFRGNLYIVSGTKASTSKQADTSKVRVVCPKTLQVTQTIALPPTPGKLPWLCNGTRLTCCRLVISKQHLHDRQIQD